MEVDPHFFQHSLTKEACALVDINIVYPVDLSPELFLAAIIRYLAVSCGCQARFVVNMLGGIGYPRVKSS